MDPVIFLEKVRRPDPRGLVRERLDHRLADGPDASAGPCSLALVLGPPGSGKTTFLSQLAADRAPAAWYRVGTEDDDELALTRHLGYSLAAALGEPRLVEATSTGRIAELVAALEEPGVGSAQLVIDDLQEITGSPAERALESFISLRPRTIGVALGTRRPPGLNTSRLLVSGELVQLDGEDLRFRSWEVEELFRAVYGCPLSPEAAAALTRRTGGWAAGLQLFHLATAHLGRVERDRAVAELSGRSRLIRSYLARNVLDGLDPDRRRFLLLTATLGVLTGDLCDALLGVSGSAAVLAELEREQFFTTSTDAGLTYHYHQVLQTHLEVVLVDELGGRAARELYARSAELLDQAGRSSAAIRAYARAEDWGAVARLLKPGTAAGQDEDLWGTLSLPGAPTDDPGLVLAGARRLARDGRIGEAVAAFQRAEALLDDPEFRRRCTAERSAAALWLGQPVLAGRTFGPNDPPLLRLSTQLRQLTRRLPEADGATTPLVDALAELLRGQPAETVRHLAAQPADSPPGWESLAVRLVDRVAGLLDHGTPVPDSLEDIVLAADVEGWPWLSRIARGLLAAALLAADPAEWRTAATEELLADLERRTDRWSACLTGLAVGVAYLQLDQAALAQASLARALRLADALDAPVLGTWARVLGAVSDEQLAAALDAASRLGITGAADVVRAVRPRGRHREPAADAALAAGAQLCCLGEFSLSLAGTEVPWRTLRPRAQTLLMLLALHQGRPVHRERLVDALWPEATLPAGIRSLQVAVSSIRQCLAAGGFAEDTLRRHGDAYALHLPAGTDQLADFERLARLARQDAGASRWRARLAALERYTGDLLPEVGAAEWVVEERARLRLLAATLASEAALGALAADELATALEAARRSVDLDPYQDSAWRLLITIHDRLRDPVAAAVARRQRARIWADLGLPPPATTSAAAPSASSRTDA